MEPLTPLKGGIDFTTSWISFGVKNTILRIREDEERDKMECGPSSKPYKSN